MKIFVTRPIPEAGIKLLKDRGYEVIINEGAKDRPAAKEEIQSGIKGADALLSVLTEKIDGEIMDAGLPTLKIIANYAVGFDNIDFEAAEERNLMVTNTPDVLTDTVAEHTFALMLAIARRISEGDRFSRAGRYKAWGPELLLGTDVSGKTLGVVGLGRIGSKVAYHAVRGFGMKVLYTDIKPAPEFEKELGAEFVDKIEDLLPRCDFVSIHVPLLYPVKSAGGGAASQQFNRVNPVKSAGGGAASQQSNEASSTYHLINQEKLNLMKPSAYLINTSRGAIIDEKALAKHLADKKIKGAAIDVFEFEPEITPELKELDNIIITPHIASATEETRNKMSELAAQNIIEALEGREPPNLVHPVK